MREFRDIPAFLQFLGALPAEVTEAEHAAVQRGAEMIEAEAKAEIGTYQGAIGDYPEWAPLAARTVKEKTELGYAPPDNPLLREGDMRDSIEHTAQGHEAAIGSNDQIAVYQELGTSRIPARSFLGRAAARTGEAVAEAIGSRTVWALRGLPKRND